ncbi:MAG: DUF1569 domain-containing protein [Bacteroidota bacterium]
MNSIFNQADTQAFLHRIDELTPESKALWGKMQVSQMLAHCQQPIRVGLGELKLKRGIIGMLFGKLARKKLTASDEPFARNMPTDKHFIIKEFSDFETEKNKLKALIRRLFEGGPDVLTKNAHPFFGRLTTRQWDLLVVKHLDHHLRQFGV